MNSGFLYGPWVPIYGFGAVLILSIETYIEEWIPFPLRILLYTFLASVLEYYTGLICEQILGVRLWDYSNKPFNIKGRICLQYSIYWLILISLFITVIYPSISALISRMSLVYCAIVNRTLIALILIDFAFSTKTFQSIIRFFESLDTDYLLVTRETFLKSIDSFRRLLNSFPDVKTYISNNIRQNLLKDFKMNLRDILGRNIVRSSSGAVLVKNDTELEAEFHQIVDDILCNDSFRSLQNYRHHNGSIFEHVKSVAYLTYRFCRNKKLDVRSAARGALLHDFFLYDWRTGKDENGVHHKGHIYLHPKMAVANAEKHFRINNIERDIILNHMWPLSPAIPKYKETFIVSFIDKYISTREFFEAFKGGSDRNGD